MRIIVSILTCLLVFTLGNPLQAQGKATFVATCDSKQATVGSDVTVEFTLSGAKGVGFKPPEFRNFDVVRKSNGSSFSIINGAATQSMTYTYILSPKKTGRLRIPAARIKVGKNTLKTTPIYVTVVKASTNKKQQSVTQLLDSGKGLFVKAVLDTVNTYLGQQIIVDYKLFTQVGVSRYNPTNKLDFPGFYAQDIQRYNNNIIGEVIDNVSYKTKVLHRAALFPQRTGIMEIPSLRIAATVQIPGTRRGRNVGVNSKVVKINVKPLPETGKPDDFTGAIGNYRMVSQIGNTTVTTDDAITLRLEITGAGDIKQVLAPKLDLPEDIFEIYDPTMKESVSQASGMVAGTKIFDYTILPRKPGNYSFAPSFSFFNPDSVRYITVTSNRYSIDVGMGSNKRATQGVQPVDEDLANRDMRLLQLETKLKKPSRGFFASIPFWLLSLLPFLFLGGVFFKKQEQIKASNIDVDLLKRQRAEQEALKQLSQAKTYLDKKESKGFYHEIAQGLWGYVSDKLNLTVSDLSKENIKEKLLSLEVNSTNVDRFVNLINTTEMALFAGMDNAESMDAVYKDAASLITDIEQELGKEEIES